MVRQYVWAALIPVFIAGCSGGQPSGSEIADAMQANVRQQISQAEDQARALGGDQGVQMMHSMGSPAPEDISIKNAEVLSSKKLDNGDYQMRVRFDASVRDKTRSRTSKVLMHHTDNGWQAEIPS